MSFAHWLVILRFTWNPTGGHMIALVFRYEANTSKREVRRRAQEEIDRLCAGGEARWDSAEIVLVPAGATETIYATQPLFV